MTDYTLRQISLLNLNIVVFSNARSLSLINYVKGSSILVHLGLERSRINMSSVH